jgi:hypothetical protein
MPLGDFEREVLRVASNIASPEFAQVTRHYGSVKNAWLRIVEA